MSIYPFDDIQDLTEFKASRWLSHSGSVMVYLSMISQGHIPGGDVAFPRLGCSMAQLPKRQFGVQGRL
ncbi:hypothetical protein [Thermosynechococcus sp. NK55a]|uniref:hypothetical protein n=1 Tax=Thermosynechococcus sp. NK55a TaxID=1394889 RepID=UPI00041A56B7|nr:hypothetical protein [Thermosynechococcus sp. NK55a]